MAGLSTPAAAPPAIRRRSGSNFLVLNLAMDAAHPVLGHSVAWTNELARRSNHVSVITMFAGELPVEDNVTVHSLGKELGHSEPRRLLDFYRLAYRVLDERPIAACFAHMAPLFSALFAPVARRRGVPVLLWYAHSSVSPTLRIAHRLANRCVTPTPAAFRLPSSKLFVIGHGIDTERFVPPAETAPGYERTLVSVGRLSPVKRVDEMIEALAVLEGERSLGLRLEVIGAPATRGDCTYAETLRRRVRELGLADRVSFHGSVPYGEVARQYH